MTNRVSITDLRNCLTQVVDQVEGGDRVVIRRRGKDVAMVAPLNDDSGSMTDDVRSFHLVSQQRLGKRPALPSIEERRVRVELLMEEFNEYMAAENEDDLAGIGHELIDLIYVAIGTGICYGLPMQKIFDAIHGANMAKSVNGRCGYVGHKIVKPPGWMPADVREIISGS